MALQHALDGIRVLDLSRLLPGPFLTMILADMGADVVKIEAPGPGDYMRPMPPLKGDMSGRFLAVNRNKRSLALNLKTEPGRDALLRMAERADVIVESFRPGVIDRLGIGYEALRARNPKIVLCSISGYGQTGPYRDRAGHDLNYVGLGGGLAMSGEPDRRPAMLGFQIADIAGGALWSATGILGALVGRERTGQGAHLDISMTEGALALLASEFGNLDCGLAAIGGRPTRGTQILNGGLACYGVYETRDGKYMSVGSLEPKFWLKLNEALGREGSMSELVAPLDKQRAIAEEIAQIFATRTREEWTAHFVDYDCCCEPVLELDEVEDHPVHQARQVFFELDGGDLGPIKQVRLPIGAPAAKNLAPRHGQHSREVLAEYGFSEDEIAELV